jgi:hypothetical protein
LLDKWPILLRELGVTGSERLFRLGYAKDDGSIIREVIIGNFVGEDLEAELMISLTS